MAQAYMANSSSAACARWASRTPADPHRPQHAESRSSGGAAERLSTLASRNSSHAALDLARRTRYLLDRLIWARVERGHSVRYRS